MKAPVMIDGRFCIVNCGEEGQFREKGKKRSDDVCSVDRII